MNIKIFVCSDFLDKFFFNGLLNTLDISIVSKDSLLQNNFKNKNILLIFKKNIDFLLSDNIFLDNKVLILSLSKKNFFKYNKTKRIQCVSGPIDIYKFLNLVKDFFQEEDESFGDIKICGDKIINIKNEKTCFLTDLEKKILLAFFYKKKIRRDYFLEEVLNINKNIETKTIESHLTRIRKKIKSIDSKINISSKSEVFFLNI